MVAADNEGPEARIAALEAELAVARRRLSELDHRIKNDLQLVASVFVLQLRKLPEGAERTAVKAALERINAVAAVHRRLDAGEDPTLFEASALVRDVAEEAANSAKRDDIRLELELEPVRVPSRQAGPLAIITGELVRNAVRHAFPDRPGAVDVAFGRVGEEARLAVRDDGVGLADGHKPDGFGMTLAGLLVQQLRGTYEVTPADPGVRVVVRFPAAA
jgi:two-component sensor histidine kinase